MNIIQGAMNLEKNEIWKGMKEDIVLLVSNVMKNTGLIVSLKGHHQWNERSKNMNLCSGFSSLNGYKPEWSGITLSNYKRECNLSLNYSILAINLLYSQMFAMNILCFAEAPSLIPLDILVTNQSVLLKNSF